MAKDAAETKIGRVALVTGGTRGIGRAIVDALSAAGATVYSVSRKESADGGGVEASRSIQGDLAQPGVATRAVREVLDRAGRLDVLVNNAGTQHVGRVDGFPREQWDKMVALHMTAPFEAIGAALPSMRENGFGRIVNVASVHGLIGSAGKGPYTATKHGLVGLTKVVALETAAEPITCNAVCPGFVRTTLIDAQIDALEEAHGLDRDAATQALLSARQPSGEMIEPDAVAALVAWLCSDAAKDVTGTALPIDGAWTAR